MTKRKAVAPGEGGTGPAPDGRRPIPCETAAAVAGAAAQVAGRRDLSGSDDSGFTLALLNQAWRAAWRGDEAPPAAVEDLLRAMVEAGLAGAAPRDPLEGMLAAQMVATHDAAMACFHRAHQPGRRHDLRQADLAQANKLVRSYAALLEGLDRHRGKGRQVVRVEHVTVNAGGRAIVGAVSRAGGGGDGAGTGRQPRARALAHAPEPALRGADPERRLVPAGGGEG